MPFLKLSNANVSFGKKTLTWKTYITHKALFITEQVQIIHKKDFVIAALNANSETFVMHMAILEQKKMPVHSKKQAQVEALIFDKAPTAVLVEYFDYSKNFSAEYVAKFLKYTKINNHVIKLEKGKQPSFGPIYSLGSVKLETLKIYIKINLTNGFIQLSKSFIRAFIFFN